LTLPSHSTPADGGQATPPRRTYPLRYLLNFSGLALFAVAALTLWVVVAAQIRITAVAVDTRDNVLPVIVTRQEVARDIERLILFGEALLNAGDPVRRRQARLAAQALVYNEPGFRSDEKIKEVGLRTLSTLADLATRLGQRDALNTEAFKLMMELDEAFKSPAAGGESWQDLLIRTMRGDSAATLDALAQELFAALKAGDAKQHALLVGKLERLVAVRREIVEIDHGSAQAWESTTRELKSVTDTLSAQAQQLTSERFSEIQQLASRAELVGSVGLGFAMLVLALFAYAAHRFFLRPLEQSTANLVQALQGEDVRLAPRSAIAEIGSIVMAAGTLVENTRTIEEERRKVLSVRLDAAESASRMKSEFLSTMGHELRTPMNGVLGMAQLLKMSELNVEQQDEVDAIIASAESLQTILADILEFVAAEDGYLVVRPNPCHLAELLGEVNAGFAVAAAAKNVAIHLDVADTVPELLTLDAPHLRKVATILLKNALAFTAQGKIELAARMDGPQCLHLTVSDTGVGMTPATVAQLFQPFYQADSSHTRRHGGIGIGLALARRIVAALGGTIAVESAPGVGSSFEIVLPVTVA